MIRFILVGLLVSTSLACHDRPGANDLRVTPGVVVGTPLHRGPSVVGRVVRVRTIGEERWATLQLDPDSVSLASLGDIAIKTTRLGGPPELFVVNGSGPPVFGPGGYIGSGAPKR